MLAALALTIGNLLAALTATRGQERFSTDAEYLAPLQRPSPEQVADSAYGRLILERLSERLSADADPECATRKQLDPADRMRRVREILISVGWRLRSHHDSTIQAEKAANLYEGRVGKGTMAELAVLFDDETVTRFLNLSLQRDSAEFASDILDHITRALLTSGLRISEETAALGLGDATSGELMARLNIAVDDFLEANRAPEMIRLRDLQIASRDAVDQATDQTRLMAFASDSLIEVMSGTLSEICILKRP